MIDRTLGTALRVVRAERRQLLRFCKIRRGRRTRSPVGVKPGLKSMHNLVQRVMAPVRDLSAGDASSCPRRVTRARRRVPFRARGRARRGRSAAASIAVALRRPRSPALRCWRPSAARPRRRGETRTRNEAGGAHTLALARRRSPSSYRVGRPRVRGVPSSRAARSHHRVDSGYRDARGLRGDSGDLVALRLHAGLRARRDAGLVDDVRWAPRR